MTATSSVAPGAVPIGMFFEVSGNAVSGPALAQIADPQYCGPCSCGTPFNNITATISGTYDAAGEIVLKTPPFGNGAVLTIKATTSDGKTFTGNYTISGACYSDQGSISGSAIALLSGTYVGTVKSDHSGTTYNASATLQQSSTLVGGMYLAVNGSVNFNGYPCFTSATLDTGSNDNDFLGSIFQVGLDTPALANIAGLQGTLSPDANTISVFYTAGGPGTGCPLDAGTGTLSLQ